MGQLNYYKMKTLKMNFLYLVLLGFSLSLTNCKSDTTVNEEQNSEELALIEFEKQISNIKSNLSNGKTTSKSESYVSAIFDIRMEGENYIIENIEYLNEFEYGFAQGFSKSSSKSSNGGGIKVSCEQTGEITECPEQSGFGAGLKQAKCVGNAVKACLYGGGCAEVCSMKAEIKQ